MDPHASRFAVSLQKRLMGLYTAACAPLSSDSLVNEVSDMEPEDFTVSIALDEIKFLKSLTDGGLGTIVKALDGLPSDDTTSGVHESPEVAVALLATATFASRLGFVANQIHQICQTVSHRIAADPTQLMKDLEARAKKGERPEGETGDLLRKSLDFTPHTKWTTIEIPVMTLSGRKESVGFKETADVILENNKVEEEALKVTEVRRRKQRNPTGYHKFTFKVCFKSSLFRCCNDDLDLMVEESDGEDGRGRLPSADDGSVHGSLSISGTTVGGGNLTSRSASSGPEDEEDYNLVDDDNTVGAAARGAFNEGRRSSSVVLFQNEDKQRQVIDDSAADPDWEEQQRHTKRFSRIRNRVPTGHPSVMKNPGDELAGIVHEYERTISSLKLDSHTAVNTEANKYIQVIHEEVTPSSSRSPLKGSKNVTLLEED